MSATPSLSLSPSAPVDPSVSPSAESVVRQGLTAAANRLQELGMPVPAVGGKLLRPQVAYLGIPTELLPRVDERFWLGALAIQMAHEASLVHDDVVDQATVRRGRPTEVAKHGIGPALVMGDHLLTSAYRAACLTGSPAFVSIFAEAVERTVAGEILQGRSRDRHLSREEYHEVVRGKTGRLFGCAMACGSAVLDGDPSPGLQDLGERVGVLYQMLDDYLDLCPSAETGKEPFQDYRGRTWTWPLEFVADPGFTWSDQELVNRLFGPVETDAPAMRRAAWELADVSERLARDLRNGTHGGHLLAELVRGWSHTAIRACDAEPLASPTRASTPWVARSVTPNRNQGATDPSPEARVAARARALGGPERWAPYFARNSRSFTFAARLFPPEPRTQVTGVYAFCRFTDDLVDERTGVAPEVLEQDLDAWSSMFEAAYDGAVTGVPLADVVAGRMREASAPLHYASELIEGVRMDIAPRTFTTMADLRTYTYRVASVVGGWLTESFDRHDPWLLGRAFSLGHAMQLTNILRDVGEDLRMGRLYLPLDVLERHGLSREALEGILDSGDVPEAYVDLLEDLMAHADREYATAFEAIPGLPRFFQRPVAVASHVYQGIHDEIRANAYDNLRRRAKTGRLRKLVLASRALLDVRRVPAWRPEPAVVPPFMALSSMERVEP